MCLKDLLKALHRDGIAVTEPQIRYAIISGKVDRPPLDGSLRFVFNEAHIAQLRTLFDKSQKEMSV